MSDNVQFIKKVLVSLAILSLFLLLGALAWYSVQMLLLIFAGILFAIFIRGVAGFLFGRVLPQVFWQHCSSAGVLLRFLHFACSSTCGKRGENCPAASRGPETFAGKNRPAAGLDQGLLEKALLLHWIRTGKIARRAMGLFATTLGSLFIILFVGPYLAFSPHYYRRGILQLFPENTAREPIKPFRPWIILWHTGLSAVSSAC